MKGIPGYRPDTDLAPQTINIVFNFGGLGDYICRMPALRILASTNPHLHIDLWVPSYFKELAEYWSEDLPGVAVHNSIYFKDRYKLGDLFMDFETRLLQPLAIDLVEHGFLMLLNRLSDSPQERAHPQRHRPAAVIDHWNLPPGYAVVCTGYTSPTRAWKGEFIGTIKRELLARGIPPVFLGRRDLEGDYKTYLPSDEDLVGGINLINQTSPLEALEIIHGAKVILGVDNGLLQLAGCTSTPIVAGFTTVNPNHRRIVRPAGKTAYVLPGDELPCRFCQSNMKCQVKVNFTRCYYGDYRCLDYMIPESFIKAMEAILEPKTKD